jgi:hypothetical protein
VAGVLAWDGLGWRDRLSVLRLAAPIRDAARRVAGGGRLDPDLDRHTVAAWLQGHRQTPRLTGLLWEPLAVAALNQVARTAAAGPFVSVLGRMFGPDTRDAAIGLPAKPLSAVFGDPARDFVEARGSEIRLHAPARLAFEGARLAGVEIRGERVRAGAVVAAVPWTAWRNVIDAERASRCGLAAIRDGAAARAPSPIVTVNLWPDRPPFETEFVGMPGRPFQWAFRKPHEAHLSLVSSGADGLAHEPADALIAGAWDQMRDAFPEARSATLVRASVVRERHATFSLAPGQPPRPPAATPVEGLWLAGDWTDTGLPATIEGAVWSGHAAAAAILRQPVLTAVT